MSFSIISILTGMPSLFLYGLVSQVSNLEHSICSRNSTHLKNTGGPAVMVWSWIIVCKFYMVSLFMNLFFENLKHVSP